MNARGLQILDEAHRVPVQVHEMYRVKGLVHGPYFYLGDKPGGVEPGILAVEINNDFMRRVEDYFSMNFDGSIEECKEFLKKLMEQRKIDEDTNEKKMASAHDLTQFAETLISEGKGKTKAPAKQAALTMWLLKQDYAEPGIAGTIGPGMRRTKETSAVKSKAKNFQPVAAFLYSMGRQKNPSIENSNAILECLANDVAHAFGMGAQEQYLVFGTYKNGALKILTASVWDKALQMIEGKLYGSASKELYENHLVEMDASGKPLRNSKGKMISNQSITNLGECLALFIAQNDRDVFGSRGGNKGEKHNLLFGFDFGHAYREASTLISTLTDDFSYKQPKDKNEKFKNLSICSDTRLSDRMAGMLYLYTMMGEDEKKQAGYTDNDKKNIEKAIKQYEMSKPGFKERLAKVQPNSFQAIFNQYIAKFEQLRDNTSDKHIKEEFDKHAKKLSDTKQIAFNDNVKMLRIFKDRMKLGPNEVDLLNNLSKFTSDISALSSDGEVSLNHLRIINNHKIHWAMTEIDKDNVIIRVESLSDLNNTRKNTYINDYIFEKMNTILREQDISGNVVATAAGTIQWIVNRGELADWMKAFSEKNILLYRSESELSASMSNGRSSESRDDMATADPLSSKSKSRESESRRSSRTEDPRSISSGDEGENDSPRESDNTPTPR